MRALILILIALCVVCGVTNCFGQRFNLSPRIVSGFDAKKGQFPYQVSIRRQRDDQMFCSGAILNDRFILTIARCAHFIKPLYAVVGTLHRIKGGVKVHIKSVIEHPEFNNPKLLNDIALLHTSHNIPFDKFIQPIPLPKTDVSEIENTRTVFSGWGRTTVSHLNLFT